MDFFGKDQFKELLDVQKGPAVSIFVKADRQNNKGKNNKLAFRDQVNRAKKMLEERYPDEEFRSVAEMMDDWLDDDAFWGSLSKGVAAFFSPEIERVYRLKTEVDDEAIVSDTFYTRPMLRTMLEPQRYWVLVFDQKNTKLFEASEDRIEEISLGDTPTSMDDALQADFPTHPSAESRQREGGAPNAQGSPAGVSGSKPAFVGMGDERDLEPRYFRQYAQIVDEGLREMLHNATGPLILAAPGRMYSHFRQESKLDNLAEEGLQESLVHLKPAKIHEKTWPLAKKASEKKIDEVLELWEREYGRGKAETDLQQIAKRTLMSQVRFLLIEEGRRVWGNIDRNEGTVEVERENGRDHTDETDVLDELAEFVISMGGEVFELPKSRMPVDTGAAAILRGSGRAEYGGERARMT
ncbi:hypothetical protein FIV42_10855 [Persicimonas caeni]|uniref:Uncharacterized protein n=1 Tax=Persicimonas caeni TaxID=2292766 RepID=A0A4Y6PSJ6_PERCE|nr:hypothetical protein [Persicimonas caeni]QDG51220.1 hypothetical protein FIV42_10855 [Persicimonas caeni]QED32441.1 hypothetical protein FRD00_10850 [Persicimonas caeni]